MPDSASQIMETLTPLFVLYGMRLIGVIILFAAAWLFAGWAGRWTQRALERVRADSSITRFTAKAVRISILVLAALGILRIFGVETAQFAVLIGAGGLAVGLAFQGTLSNFSAGVMLLIFRPFKVEDWVNLNGLIGCVKEIGLFSTAIDTGDNRRIIMPNSQIYGSTIENISFHPTRRVDIPVSTEYRADLDLVRRVLQETADNLPGRISEKDSVVMLMEMGKSSIDWVVRVWCNSSDYWTMRDALTRNIKIALDNAGIGIPFPQMDVHFDKTA